MKLVYHLGYPRTATKLLQHRLFGNHTLINYLGPKSHDDNLKYYFDQFKIDSTEIEGLNIYNFLKVYDFNYTYDLIRTRFPGIEITKN